jgi:hypothetical protein
MTRQRAQTPTWRAGANLRDDSQSGYARVHVLGQEDLFPSEGYEFPVNLEQRHTRTYKISEESPFNCTRPLKMVHKQTADQILEHNVVTGARQEYTNSKTAYRATKTPIDGELRPMNSKIVIDIVKKERAAQDLLAEELKIARMQDEAYWCDVEHDEGIATQRIGRELTANHRRRQRTLAENYHQQFADHAAALEREKQEDRLEAQKMRRMEIEDAQAEDLRQEQLRKVARQRTREFQLRNDEMLQRKERRIEDDLAKEKIVQQQNAEVAMRMEAREKAEKDKRDAKTAWRSYLIDLQAQDIIARAAKRQQTDTIAQSELQEREERDRAKREEKAAQMRRERNQEWLDTQRQRDTKMIDVKDVPDFDNRDTDELKRVNAYWRHKRAKDLQSTHRTQMKERHDVEDEEVRERRSRPEVMYFLPDNER